MQDYSGHHEIVNLIFESVSRTGVTIVTDSNDCIVAISDNYIKILNRKRKDVIGRHVSRYNSQHQDARHKKIGKAGLKSFYPGQWRNSYCPLVPLIKDRKAIGVFAYTSMNTIDYMSTLSTVEIVRRLNDELNQFKKELQKLRGAKYSWKI